MLYAMLKSEKVQTLAISWLRPQPSRLDDRQLYSRVNTEPLPASLHQGGFRFVWGGLYVCAVGIDIEKISK